MFVTSPEGLRHEPETASAPASATGMVLLRTLPAQRCYNLRFPPCGSRRPRRAHPNRPTRPPLPATRGAFPALAMRRSAPLDPGWSGSAPSSRANVTAASLIRLDWAV